MRETYARSLVQWKEGDYFLRKYLNATSNALLATRLFNSVRIEREPPLPGKDVVPVTIVVVERPFRSWPSLLPA